jgi:hypothetical protein
MKVTEIVAEGNYVFVALEPEHPAEVALLKLMDGCTATCGEVAKVGEGAAPTAPTLRVNVAVKRK